MKQLTSYEDVLPKDETALALFTDGTNFRFNPTGLSFSGRWGLNTNRSFTKVLVYKKVGVAGEIYLGDYHSTIQKPNDDYYYVRFKGAKLKGRTEVLWTKFTNQPNGRTQRIYLPRPKTTWSDPTEDDERTEGGVTKVVVNKYERDLKARKKCIAHHGLQCDVCELVFSERYGAELGSNFIHVHHLTPLSKNKKTYVVDPIKDLIPVCPNCHAMLHKGKLSPSELRSRLVT